MLWIILVSALEELWVRMLGMGWAPAVVPAGMSWSSPNPASLGSVDVLLRNSLSESLWTKCYLEYDPNREPTQWWLLCWAAAKSSNILVKRRRGLKMMVNVGFLWGFGQVGMGSLAEMTGIAFSSIRRNRIIGNPRINLIHRQFPERIFGLLVQDIWGKF